MQVIIKINDRQALPVRAIPLLTDWHGLSPDGLAQILAGDSDHWPSFDGLTAHRLHSDGSIEAIPPRWWVSWVVGELEATSNTIKAKETSRATGRQQWRRESLAQLPAGVFVWRDEFEAAHSNEYRPDGRRARSNPEGFDPSAHALDFNPNPNPLIAPAPLVMEGFEPLIAPPGSRNLEHLWFVRGCYGAGDNDTHWLGLKSLSPHEAAALLCGRDPLVQRGCDEQCVVLLERRLTDYNESHPARRSWREWHGVAKEIEAEYQKGFDEFFSELAQISNTSAARLPTQTVAPAAPVVGSASNAPKKARRDLLAPLIEAAQRECGNPFDAPAVWASLVKMAADNKRPLLGVTDEGIKWQDSNDNPKFLLLRNLRDRLRRREKKAL